MAEVNPAGQSPLSAWSPVGSCLSSRLLDINRTELVLFSVSLISAAGGVLRSRENLPETETKNKGWRWLGENSLPAFGISACFVSRGPCLPFFWAIFLRMLSSKQRCRRASPSGVRGGPSRCSLSEIPFP